MALVQVQPTLEADDRRRVQVTQQQSAGMTGRRGRRPTRQLAEWDRGDPGQRVGQAAQAGSQDQPDPWDQRRPGSHSRFERVEGVGPGSRGQGVVHRGQDTRWDLRPADEGIDTGMPITPHRPVPTSRPAPECHAGQRQTTRPK